MNGNTGVIIALLTLLFMVISAILGLLLRAVVKWTRFEDTVTQAIRGMETYRKITDRRLQFIEQWIMRKGSS